MRDKLFDLLQNLKKAFEAYAKEEISEACALKEIVTAFAKFLGVGIGEVNGAAITVEHTDRFSRSIEFGENVVRTVLLPKKILLIIRGLDYTQPENVPLFYASFFILNKLNLKYATLFNPFN